MSGIERVKLYFLLSYKSKSYIFFHGPLQFSKSKHTSSRKKTGLHHTYWKSITIIDSSPQSSQWTPGMQAVQTLTSVTKRNLLVSVQLDPLINSIDPLNEAQHSSIYVNKTFPLHLRLIRSPQQTLQQRAELTTKKRINKQEDVKVNNVKQPTSSVKPLISTVQSKTRRHTRRQHTQHTLLYLSHTFLCQTPFLPTASISSPLSLTRLATMQKECKRPWGC